jgi:hypothetical protein
LPLIINYSYHHIYAIETTAENNLPTTSSTL